MLKTYLKLAIRNLWKNKLYSAINILGLSVGLSACVLIVLFVRNELSYDKHFDHSEHIYRLTGAYNMGGDAKTYSVSTTYPLLPVLATNFPEMEVAARFDNLGGLISRGDQHINQGNILIADSTFFELFSFEAVSGDLSKALSEPNSVVFSQQAATVHFGDENPMGQTVRLYDTDLKVTGIFKDLPDNTHFEADVIVPMSTGISWYGDWVQIIFNGTSHYSYFRLAEGIEPESLETRINTFLTENYKDNGPFEYTLQPMESIHLHSDLVGEIGANGNYTTVLIFIATAVVILLLACINYINLSVASAFQRGMEVGLKKIFGAKAHMQVFQFQAESVIVALVATILSVILVEFALPTFNQLTNGNFDFLIQEDILLGLSLFGVALLIGLVSGSFPALFLLKMKTSETLKSNAFNSGKGKFRLRNGLIVFQFFIAVVLIASTFIILNQIRFLRNADLGIDTEQVVVVPIGGMNDDYELLREELLRDASVINVTASNNHPANRVGHWRGYTPEGNEESISSPTVIVSHDFFETFGAQMLEGRSFNREFQTDYLEAYVINESAVDFFQLEDPIGKGLVGGAYTGEQWTMKNAKIIGVVKDFHFASLHSEIRPTVFSLNSDVTWGLNYMSVRIAPENISETLRTIENAWKQFAGDEPFGFTFLDEDIDQHYQAEDQFLSVFTSFTFLSIIIGCLGLFGLTAFMMRRRTKEIGIRKVLGANITGLIAVLSKDFLKLVLIANILGWPLAYYLMDRWLQNFAYSNGISWMVFAITGAGALLIAFISVVYHSVKTANTNPVKSIRYE